MPTKPAKARAIEPGSGLIYFNMGLVYDKRRDLVTAEEWYRKAVKAAPAYKQAREWLNVTIRRRAERARMDQVDSGRANPTSAAEAIHLAELAHRGFDKWYGLAVRLYRRGFAIDPALADDLSAERNRLTNRMRHSGDCERWEFGLTALIAALMRRRK